MRKRIIVALQKTWQAIGFDVIECTGGDVSAEEVRGCVGDYIETHGGDEEAAREFDRLYFDSAEEADDLLEEAFPDGKYGL